MDQDLSARICQQGIIYNGSLPIYHLVEDFALLSSATVHAQSCLHCVSLACVENSHRCTMKTIKRDVCSCHFAGLSFAVPFRSG